ncbi:MAG: transcriptional regulator [Actinomycetota bacterium]|nr:transcriptional regulator [Actinomycetota bacterium]
MTPTRRWICVAVALALLIGVPLGIRALPREDSTITASALLDRIEGSRDLSYSGYIETLGTLQLPVADNFTDVGELFGERTRMRAWWRDADEWRVDKLLATGETDIFHDASGTTLWDYEKSRLTRTVDADIRLPRASDLLPPELAHRLLADVDRADLSRLPTERIAGRDAPGLRLSPGASQSSVDHVDVWADPDTGLAVRVEVFARGAETAALTTRFLSLSLEKPSRSTTAFSIAPGAEVEYDEVIDIAAAANLYAPLKPPHVLAGLTRSSSSRKLRAVGVYGAGVTQLIAIPLWDRAAEPLREQLRLTPGVRQRAVGDGLNVGPLNVLLTESDGGGGWLITGTVTRATLLRAGRQLDDEVTYLGGPHPP